MNALSALTAALPRLQTSIDILCVILPLAAFMSFTGIGFISASAKILSLTRKRASFDKCARQLAAFGLAWGWLLLVVCRIWLYLTQNSAAKPASFSGLTELSWLLLACSVLFISLYYALWKFLRNLPALHIVLGIASSLTACAALVAALFTERLAAAPQSNLISVHSLGDAVSLIFNLILSEQHISLWNALCCTPLLILAFSGGAGALWLFMRRRYDDFGRDHYNTMIRWCAYWARNAWALLWLLFLIFTLLQIRRSWQGDALAMQDIALQTARLLFWLIPCLLWSFVCRSAVALRHKFTLLAALCTASTFMLPYYLEVTDAGML